MNTFFISKQSGWCAACALALGFAFGTAQAGDVGPGARIWKNSHGEWCWNRAFVAAVPPSDCADPYLVAESVVPPPFVAAASAKAQPVAPALAQAQSVAPAAPALVQAQSVAPAAAPAARPRKMDRN